MRIRRRREIIRLRAHEALISSCSGVSDGSGVGLSDVMDVTEAAIAEDTNRLLLLLMTAKDTLLVVVAFIFKLRNI
jgi:hypothetical protein